MSKANYILEYIVDYINNHGYPPVIREIQEGCDISSTSVVAYHLDKLVKSGDISKGSNKARTIKVYDKSILSSST